MPELRGLYAITDARLMPPAEFSVRAAAALRGGARLIQYRDKSADAGRRLAQARELRTLCDASGAVLIINDDLALAASVGADGVHLGRDDADIAAAREHLGAAAIIGISCYASLPRARAAAAAGADYLAFGSVFSSPTKPQAPPAPVAVLSQARRELGLPVCAIGGIQRDNAAGLIDAGIDMLAVISDLFGADDIQAAAVDYACLFRPSSR